MNIFSQLKPEWHSTPPQDLLDAPPTALKRISEGQAKTLQEVLGASDLRSMANQPVVGWVWRTVSLFRAGVQTEMPEDAAKHVTDDWRDRACAQWASSPLSSLSELSAEDVDRLGNELGWLTIRQMAGDEAFETAREVHRIVTGEPVPPEDSAIKPVPDYFAGGTQRYLNRKREEAGQPTVPPPPPPPPPPPAAAPQPTVAPPETLAEGMPESAASMPSENLSMPANSDLPHSSRAHRKDYTPEGTYIPRGGGSRGWLNNDGVARTERSNGYRYQEAVNSMLYKRAGLEETVRANNRGSERKELRMQVRWAGEEGARATPGLCRNVSITGAGLRVGQQFKEDTLLYVTWVYRDDLMGIEHSLLQLAGRVVWCRSVNVNYRVPRYDCGIRFEPMSLEDQERLTMLLTDRMEDLVSSAAPEDEAAQAL